MGLNSYTYTRIDKILGLARLCRQRLAPRRNLIAGPFAGEFGFEVMRWQGFVRARRAHYEKTYVITYPGRDFLYEGCTVLPHKIELSRAGYGFGWTSAAEARRMARETAAAHGIADYDVLGVQDLSTRYGRRVLCPQKMIRLRSPALPGGPRDVAFHFRSVVKTGHDQLKNYSHDKADAAVRILQERGIRVCCIGHPEYSYCPPFCEDLRSANVEASVAAIISSRLVAGENSGPMHLANLCGRPTLLWAAAQWRIDYSLRWNPFKVPIHVVTSETHQPEPELVAEKAAQTLAGLEERELPLVAPYPVVT